MVLTLQTHRSPEGRVTTVSVMLHDISATRLAERQLALSEARTRAVIDAMAEGVVVQDKAGRIISCNASAERVLGLTADQLFGRTSMDPAWYAVDAAGLPLPGEMHPVMRARRDGVQIDEDVMGVQRPDGSRVWLSVNARPIRGSIDEHDAAAAPVPDLPAWRVRFPNAGRWNGNARSWPQRWPSRRTASPPPVLQARWSS